MIVDPPISCICRGPDLWSLSLSRIRRQEIEDHKKEHEEKQRNGQEALPTS